MRFSVVAVVTVALVAGFTGGTAATAETRAGLRPEPWQQFRTTNFTAPAGRYCDFDLEVTAVQDEEEVRVGCTRLP